MTQERPLRDAVRAAKVRAQEAVAKRAAAEQAARARFDEGSRAWPLAHKQLVDSIGRANADLQAEGVEEKFTYAVEPCGAYLAMAEITLHHSSGQPKATARLHVRKDGNIDVHYKHSIRREHSTIKLVSCSREGWDHVLTRLYSITLPSEFRQ